MDSKIIVPEKEIPSQFYDEFTLNGKIPVSYNYFDNVYRKELYWPRELVDCFYSIAKAKGCTTYESDRFLYPGLDRFRAQIAHKDVGVIGSTRPCYEALLLTYDAHPFTIEYGTIRCEDPRITTYTVAEFEKHPRTFDALLSVSSLEHDGLGRYGDPIHPNADLMFMEKALTLIPPDGLFFLQIPVGKDRVVFNEQRIYGKIRLPLLLKGWHVIGTCGFNKSDLDKEGEQEQPLFILSPTPWTVS